MWVCKTVSYHDRWDHKEIDEVEHEMVLLCVRTHNVQYFTWIKDMLGYTCTRDSKSCLCCIKCLCDGLHIIWTFNKYVSEIRSHSIEKIVRFSLPWVRSGSLLAQDASRKAFLKTVNCSRDLTCVARQKFINIEYLELEGLPVTSWALRTVVLSTVVNKSISLLISFYVTKLMSHVGADLPENTLGDSS